MLTFSHTSQSERTCGIMSKSGKNETALLMPRGKHDSKEVGYNRIAMKTFYVERFKVP